MRNNLARDGWVTPDTYDNCFNPVIDGPSVYLFLLYPRWDFGSALVAYVGMSTQLSKRLEGHPILTELNKLDCWYMRWFKPTSKHTLRVIERKYIHKFDPPWNIIGRKRGINNV